MSLGIFLFDWTEFINSLPDFGEIPEPAAVPEDVLLEAAENILQNVATTDSGIDDILMAAALNNTVTSIIAAETAKPETPKPSTVKPPVIAPATPATQAKIDPLLQSLQILMTHNYRELDIECANFTLNNIRNIPKKELPRDNSNKIDKLREERKKEDRKLETLRAELRIAMFRNNTDV